MAGGAIKDFAKATLTAGIAAGATSLTVGSGEGEKFPSTFNFPIVIWNSTDFADPADDPAVEELNVSNKVGDVFTFTASVNAHNTAGRTYKIIQAPVKSLFIGSANQVMGTDSGATKVEHKTLSKSGPVSLTHSVGGLLIGADTPIHVTSGMELLSGPDSDKLNTQMMLRRARWIAMHDGRRIVPNQRLVLDKSLAVGVIGGWQATPTINTLNKVFYLVKSADLPTVTDGLFAQRALDYFNDTSFVTATNAGRALRLATGTATDKLAQGAQFTTAIPLRYVILYLLKTGSPTGNTWVSLYSSSAGDASSILKTSRKFDVSLLTTTETLVVLVFDDPYSVLTATQYHLVLEGDYTKSDANNITWRGVAAGGYASGVAREFNGSAWANASGVGDFDFQVGLERNDTLLVPPAGYDLNAHVGWAFINAAGNIKRCRQTDGRLETFKGADWKVASLTTTRTLLDLGLFIPPKLTRCRFTLGNDASNKCAIGHHSALDIVTTNTDTENTAQLIAVAGSDSAPCSGNIPMIGLEVQRALVIDGATSGIWLNDFEWTPE